MLYTSQRQPHFPQGSSLPVLFTSIPGNSRRQSIGTHHFCQCHPQTTHSVTSKPYLSGNTSTPSNMHYNSILPANSTYFPSIVNDAEAQNTASGWLEVQIPLKAAIQFIHEGLISCLQESRFQKLQQRPDEDTWNENKVLEVSLALQQSSAVPPL